MNDQAFELLMSTVKSTHKMIEKIERDSAARSLELQDEIKTLEEKVEGLNRFKSKVLGFAAAISFITTGATTKFMALPVDFQKKSIEKLVNKKLTKGGE